MRCAIMMLQCGVCLCIACHKPESNSRNGESEPGVKLDADIKPEYSKADVPIHISPQPDEEKRWLLVEKHQKNAPGAWADGSFNAKRNKIIIRIRDAQQFAIDTSRIPIDWSRPVILSINERNSELKRRDYEVLHFSRNAYGQWFVVEP